jgi:uncharacterized protein YndB with AHSA1/START domain
MVRVSRPFAVPAERVFDAWTDPRLACKFLFATPAGEMLRCEIDARVGGPFLIVERRGDVSVEHIGVFLEVARPRRLSFLLRVPYYSTASSRVSVGLLPMEAGCEVVVAQEGVAEELASRTEEGWRHILEGLNAVLAD